MKALRAIDVLVLTVQKAEKHLIVYSGQRTYLGVCTCEKNPVKWSQNEVICLCSDIGIATRVKLKA